MSGVNSIANQRARLYGHLHTDIQAHYFVSNVYTGGLLFLKAWVQKIEAASGPT